MQPTLMPAAGKFPFGLDDLQSWTIKRNDGTSIKYVLTAAAIYNPANGQQQGSTPKMQGSFSAYCDHTPTDLNALAFFPAKGQADLRLWVANMGGAKKTRDTFDFIIDCGDILTIRGTEPYLEGDEEMITLLESYVTAIPKTRHLKIDWEDRGEPLVAPEFWVELNKIIYGDVMTCCVGGHGRSGTSFTCLMLVNAPDYDALDALIHTRAVHCPRAIESVVQHEYIDRVATYLKRKANAKDAHLITDYKAAFMASKKPTAIRTRIELGWEKAE